MTEPAHAGSCRMLRKPVNRTWRQAALRTVRKPATSPLSANSMASSAHRSRSFRPRISRDRRRKLSRWVLRAFHSGLGSASVYGNAIKSDGYRVNNALDQRNGIGNINYSTPDLTAFLTLSGDDQKLGLPGGRLVDPSSGLNELASDRRGTKNPFDYGDKQGASATAGFTKS